MIVLFSIVLPIFALIGAGWLARRAALFGAGAAAELNRFVVFLGLPALLFHIMAKADFQALDQPRFAAAFGLGSILVFAATLLVRRARGVSLADAGLDGLNAGYANTGFIGFPLCLAAFGPASLTLVTISAIITVCVLFALAIIVVESTLQKGARLAVIGRVALSLARNPLVLAPVLGVIYGGLGLGLPAGVERFLTLLGDNAASPVALVSLGAFLADARGRPDWRSLSALTALKLIGQPALTWLLARFVFQMAPQPTAIAVVLAALPTGTGPYMLAQLYRRDATVTAGTIMATTILSVATISVLLALFN
jgi:malonate transporter and related proteins